MKKSLRIIVLMLLVTTAAHAQLPVKFGLKGGLNITKVKFDKDIAKADNRTGFFIGPMAEFTIPIVGIGADVAVLYDQKNIEVNDTKEKLQFIDIPINLKYTLGLGSMAGIYFATGPQFSFNVGDKKLFDSETYKMKSSNFSWNVGAGVKLINHIQVGYNYNIAMGKTADVNSPLDATKKIKMKNNSHQISVAYLF
ncbi:MAG: porin family protein [Bacteroidaceae bacterium]|nr:porin family protein [Bacteroidaceae bacterium]